MKFQTMLQHGTIMKPVSTLQFNIYYCWHWLHHFTQMTGQWCLLLLTLPTAFLSVIILWIMRPSIFFLQGIIFGILLTLLLMHWVQIKQWNYFVFSISSTWRKPRKNERLVVLERGRNVDSVMTLMWTLSAHWSDKTFRESQRQA